MRYAIFTTLLAIAGSFGLAGSASAQFTSSSLSGLLQTATSGQLARPIPQLPPSANTNNLNNQLRVVNNGYLTRPVPNQGSVSADTRSIYNLLGLSNASMPNANRFIYSRQTQYDLQQSRIYLNSLPPSTRIFLENQRFNYANQSIKNSGNRLR